MHESIDESSVQGGLLPLISPADPTFPSAVRQVIVTMHAGQISDPISLESGFAILKLERKIDGINVPFDDVKEELTALVQRQAERMQMQQLGAAMLKEASITVLDPVLEASWKQYRADLDAR